MGGGYMKKVLIFIILASLLIFCIVLCAKNVTDMEETKINEENGTNNTVVDGSEIQTENENSIFSDTKFSVILIGPDAIGNDNYLSNDSSKQIQFTLNGKNFDLEYSKSEKGILYNSDYDTYATKNDDYMMSVKINKNTSRVDCCSFYEYNSGENSSNRNIMDENDCLDIAKQYLKQYTDLDCYNVNESNYNENKKCYNFKFVKFIEGIETSDCARISVNVFGDIISFNLGLLGEMKDAFVPSVEEMLIIQNKIKDRIDLYYESKKDNFYILSELSEFILVRMKDGKYAFKCTLDTKLVEKTDEVRGYGEKLELYIYIE